MTGGGIDLIECGGEDAGLIAPYSVGVRFYAGSRRFEALDGHVFASARAARRAVAEIGRCGEARRSPSLARAG